MKCPYLSITPKKRCIKMTEEKMDEELTDFDLKHFCERNPIYCYYFRRSTPQENARQMLAHNVRPTRNT